MFLNIAYLSGRSGINRLMFTSLIILIIMVLGLNFATAQDATILRVGLPPAETLDPALGSNDPEVLFNVQIYDRLIDVLPNNTLVANLATDWTISDDGLVYTFNLAEGVTFHDGSDFTADDVVFTFNRLVALESAAANLLGEFEVEAVDDLTVQFTLPSINADFLFGIASRFASILSAGTDEPNVIVEGDNPFANFNGTGPFILTDYSAGESATFVANENYWIEGQPVLDGVEFLFIGDSQARVDALRSGTVDFVFKINVAEVPTLEGESGIDIIQQPTNQHPVIRIRSDEGSLGEDVRIRQAFKLSTNRQELLDIVQEGFGVVGNNDPIGPAFGEFYTPIEQAFDPEAACALVQEATGEERIETDFYVSLDFANYGDLGLALRDQWSQGCIDVNVIERDPGIYYGDGEWLEVDLGITGWADRPTPQGYLTQAYVADGAFNETHWDNEEMNALVAAAGQTADLEARAQIYARVSAVFAESGPIIIPWFSSIIGGVNENVEGLQMHAFPGQTDFRTVSISQ